MEFPDFSFEKRLWKKKYKFVAGLDEVGRGCFAGPVIASCVVFAPFSSFHFPFPNEFSKKIIINDSKRMTIQQRERAYFWIRKNAVFYGIGRASVGQINKLGIKKATEIAFRKAIKNCRRPPNYLLIDAFYIPYVRGLRRRNQLPIVHGDGKSISIAAASILAKVYRDKLMTDLGKQRKYQKYRWGKNKGYGTKEHQKAIKKYGTTLIHRKQFVETWRSKI
jgi:ribonuclease HII